MSAVRSEVRADPERVSLATRDVQEDRVRPVAAERERVHRRGQLVPRSPSEVLDRDPDRSARDLGFHEEVVEGLAAVVDRGAAATIEIPHHRTDDDDANIDRTLRARARERAGPAGEHSLVRPDSAGGDLQRRHPKGIDVDRPDQGLGAADDPEESYLGGVGHPVERRREREGVAEHDGSATCP